MVREIFEWITILAMVFFMFWFLHWCKKPNEVKWRGEDYRMLLWGMRGLHAGSIGSRRMGKESVFLEG
jgi:hypothetical protein